MPQEKVIYGKTYRHYINGDIWISSDGTKAGIEGENGQFKPRAIRKDRSVQNASGRRISVAEAVMVCFGPRYPKDGKQYVISFKDGNKENCSKQNLQWLPYHYQHATSDEVKIDLGGIRYTVEKNGTIKKGKEIVATSDSFYDPDMDLLACTDPYISIPSKGYKNGERVSIDDVMRLAGFVQGDDADLLKPVILHRDLDWKNFASDNLEWTEATDQRYLDYQAKKKADMKLRSQEINQGNPIPDYWI